MISNCPLSCLKYEILLLSKKCIKRENKVNNKKKRIIKVYAMFVREKHRGLNFILWII